MKTEDAEAMARPSIVKTAITFNCPIFRLAHHMQLPELSSLALASFSSQLTTTNLASELFIPEAMKYEELKKVVVEVAAKQWASVKRSEGMVDVQERTKEDEGFSSRFAKVMSEVIMKI